MKIMKEYNNPAWEPYFPELAPILSKIYFATSFGTIRYLIAWFIFTRMGWRESRWME